MAKEGGITAYAAHRREKYGPGRGATKQAIENALRDGRIECRKEGRRRVFDFAACDRMWEDRTDPTRGGHAGRDRENGQPRQDTAQLNRARAAKMAAEAALRRIELDLKQGEVVRVAEVAHRWFEHVRRARDAFSVIPARVAGQLASETDARRVEAVLGEEIRKALELLAGDPP